MPTVVIENIPAHLHVRLATRAAENGRSLADEILAALELSFGSPRPDGAAVLERIDMLRSGLRVSPLTEAVLGQAKAYGRH